MAAATPAAGTNRSPVTAVSQHRQGRTLTAERLEALAALAQVQCLELTIEKIVLGGDGLARWRGLPIFVPRAAPGDVVEARITARRPSYARAEIERIVTAGPSRREAPCPYYDECGGCHLQHIEDEQQLGLKAAAAAETLRRLGGIDPAQLKACRFEEPVGERQWGYRLRAQLHSDPHSDGSVGVGLRRRRSHDLVPIDRCPVLAPALEARLSDLPQLLGAAVSASRPLPRRFSLATDGLDEGDGVVAAPPLEGLPGGVLELELLGRRLTYDARCFFQAHGGLLEPLAASAVGSFEGDAAVELYAGIGFFTVGLADRYQSVTAVEGQPVAARYARNNLRRNGLRHCRVERAAVESWVDGKAGGAGLRPGLDRVLVDPPRVGLAWNVRRDLLRAAPTRLTYVSCDPATLARDLGELTRGFDLESISFFDIFPQTAHLETVVQLRRRG